MTNVCVRVRIEEQRLYFMYKAWYTAVIRISGVRIYGLGAFSRSFARGDSLSSKGKLENGSEKKCSDCFVSWEVVVQHRHETWRTRHYPTPDLCYYHDEDETNWM